MTQYCCRDDHRTNETELSMMDGIELPRIEGMMRRIKEVSRSAVRSVQGCV